MSATLRIILILGSIATCIWVLVRIRKAQVKIEDSVFWFLFSAILVLIGVFPGIVSWGADIIGVLAPVNFIFLVVIFVLIVKLFRLSIRISQLDSKVQTLTQKYALDHMDSKASGEREPNLE